MKATVLKKDELMELLKTKKYKLDKDGDWVKGELAFVSTMFQFCGIEDEVVEVRKNIYIGAGGYLFYKEWLDNFKED